MTGFYLGADIGGSKTRVLVADEAGQALGFSESGPGSPELVGYPGMVEALHIAVGEALAAAGLGKDQILGAGFGVAGYDWPSQRADVLQAIAALGLRAPVEAVNDVLLGLLAGTPDGWGVALVAGTGCNCRGWDRGRRREGRVTGNGLLMGEAAGASELVAKAIQAVAYAWTRRGPATALSEAFLEYTRSSSLEELLEGLATGRKSVGAAAAPLVIRAAAAGDRVAGEVVHWAGLELGELANSVIRQLDFEPLSFEVVLIGSLFKVGPPLLDPLGQTIHALAPGARLSRLTGQPVGGAALLGMEAAGRRPAPAVRRRLNAARLGLPETAARPEEGQDDG